MTTHAEFLTLDIKNNLPLNTTNKKINPFIFFKNAKCAKTFEISRALQLENCSDFFCENYLMIHESALQQCINSPYNYAYFWLPCNLQVTLHISTNI